MEFKSLKNIESSFRQIRLFSIVFLASCTLLTGFFRLEILPVRRGAAGEDLRAGRGEVAHHGPLAGRRAQPPGGSEGARAPPARAILHAGPRQGGHRVEHKPGDVPGRQEPVRVLPGLERERVLQPAHQRERQPDDGGGQHGLRFRQLSLPRHHLCRQMIIRGSNITERSLVTRCRLQSTVRSDNNPQGFLAEHFEILENRDLRTVER